MLILDIGARIVTMTNGTNEQRESEASVAGASLPLRLSARESFSNEYSNRNPQTLRAHLLLNSWCESKISLSVFVYEKPFLIVSKSCYMRNCDGWV